MANIELIDMSVTSDSVKVRIDRVRRKHTNGIWPDEEIVVVKTLRGLVVVLVKTDLRGVSKPDEILSVIIHDERVLMTVGKRVQFAIGVLFRLIKPNDVELVTIGMPRTENSGRSVRVRENEAAKIAREKLRAKSG